MPNRIWWDLRKRPTQDTGYMTRDGRRKEFFDL